jgi:molybdate/tungstate transport system substrate-binding protein
MKKFENYIKWIFVFFLGLAVLFPFSIGAEPQGKLIIFHAGSLTVPFAKMEKFLEGKYPKLDILRTPGGSTKMARMISELHKPADIMGSADYKIIDKTLIPQYADWNIRFAANQLVLCYTDKSRFAEEVNAENWYKILARKGVVWGHSDPNLDPCGYRSLMVLQLAEKHYKAPGLYDQLIANRPKENVRAKSVDLVALLETGNMDYAWEYLSVAVQHGLKYVVLPDEINLGSYKYDDFYKQAEVKVTGKKPGTWMTRQGQSCTYGITIIKNAPNLEAAVAFMGYLMDPNGGLQVLKDMGQPPFIPCRVSSEAVKAKLPLPIQKWVEVKN